MGSPRRIPFRVALLTLVVGLVLLAVLSIGVVGHVTSAKSVEDLQSRYFRATSEAVAARVRLFLEPALTALRDVRGQVREKRVDVDDEADLTRYLAGRLGHLPHLAWMSYSDHATGRFLGIWRREDGALVRNRSDPAANGGTPVEHVLLPGGGLEPLDRQLKGGYDPRTAAWYRAATSATEPVWSDPFLFNEGRLGITAALAVPSDLGDAPIAVLTADFFLAGLAQYLREVAGDASTAVDVLRRTGAVVASSRPSRDPEQADAHLRSALSAAPVSVASVPAGGAASWSFDEGDERRIAGITAFSTSDGGEWVVTVSVPEDRFLAGVHGNRRVAMLLGGLVTLLAVLLGWLLSRRIAEPLRRVSEELGRVALFEISPTALPDSRVEEIHVVTDATEKMKTSLRSFGRYVPTDLVRDLVAGGAEARLGARRRALTVVFLDIVGFTRTAETMDPDALIAQLGEYFEATCAVLHDHGGTIDKFIGDGILAFFNAPRDVERHAERACRAALAIDARLAPMAGAWAAQGKPVLRPRTGLHTGHALVGNVGTPERFGYTAIGDAVNLASRLESLNKRYGTSVLASEEVVRDAGPDFEWRRVERVAVAGRAQGAWVFELLGPRGGVDPRVLAARDAHEAALDAFHRREFAAASRGFEEASRLRTADAASRVLLERARSLVATPPSGAWDATHVMTEK